LRRMTDSIDRLHEAVLAARQLDPAASRTARLLQAGRSKVAKKFGEEAFEVVIDALNGSREALVRESADLLYHLVVLWAATGVSPRDVWKETDRRESCSGSPRSCTRTTRRAASSRLRRCAVPARATEERECGVARACKTKDPAIAFGIGGVFQNRHKI
jgi:phosphoribosyl-ATP pyrophosphohydrolase